MKTLSFLICCFLSVCVVSAQAKAKVAVVEKNLTCGDFLSKIGMRPKDLEFVDCKDTHDAQIHVFEAHYRVAGMKAHRVETYLTKISGMPQLRHVCCVWESTTTKTQIITHGVIGLGNFAYSVEMGTGETVVSDREHWREIDYFYITVTQPLELP